MRIWLYAVSVVILLLGMCIADMKDNVVLKEQLCPSKSMGAENTLFSAMNEGIANDQCLNDLENNIFYQSIVFDKNLPGFMDIISNVIDNKSAFPMKQAMSFVSVAIAMIIILVLTLIIIPIIWCCSCCCLKGGENESSQTDFKSNSQVNSTIELPTVATQDDSNYVGDGNESRTPAFTKRGKGKNNNKKSGESIDDDCCAWCCCCCGRICGIICGFMGLILSIISLFFAIFACANGAFSGFPDKIGEVTEVFDSASDWARNTLQIVKGPIVDDLILKDGIKTIDKFQNIFFDSLNTDLLVDDLKTVNVTLHKLPTGEELRYNVDGINKAMDIFPKKEENDKNFNDFSNSINTLTGSLDSTITVFQNTIDKSQLINIDGFSNDDANQLDESVTSIWYSDYDGIDKLLTTATSADWKTVKDSTSCESTECQSSIEIVINDLDEFRKMEIKNITLITDQLIPNINNYITSLDGFTTGAESIFTKLHNSINNLKLSSFTESLHAVNTTVIEFDVNPLTNTVDVIKNATNTLPPLVPFANLLNNTLEVVEVVNLLNRQVDNIMNMSKNLLNVSTLIDALNSIKDETNQITQLTGSIKESRDQVLKMDEFIQKASDLSEMNKAIDTINNQINEYKNNVKIMDMIKNMDNLTTYFNNYMFEIQTVSVSFKEKLQTIKTYYDANSGNINLNFISQKYDSIKNETGDALYNNFKSFKDKNCDSDCKTRIDTYIDQSSLSNVDNYKQLVTLIKDIKSDEKVKTLVYDSTNPFPYSIYRQLAENVKTELPNYSGELNELKSIKQSMNDNVPNLDDIKTPLNEASDTITDLKPTIDNVAKELDNYDLYTGYINDLSPIYPEGFLDTDKYDKNKMSGRIQNMIWNPIVPKISSLNSLTYLVEDFVGLHNKFQSYITKFGDINAKDKVLEKTISNIEAVIVDLLCEVFPESRSTYENFVKNDEDYLKDKNKIISYDVKNSTFTGLYYLWYFINFGDDDSKLSRKAGDMIENPDTESALTCLTNDCVKESVKKFWENNNMKYIMGKPDTVDKYNDINDIIGYIKLAGSLSQPFVIIIPIFVVVFNIIYLIFRLKKHSCVCECMYGFIIYILTMILLLLGVIGSLGSIQMFLCNFTPDTIGLMSKSEPFVNKMVKEINSNDFSASYADGIFSITIKDTETVKGTTLSMNVYDVVKDYLGNCEYDNPPPLQSVVEDLSDYVTSFVNSKAFNEIIDKASENGVSGDLLTTLDDFVKKDVTVRMKEMLDTLLVSGTLGCKEVNTVMKSVGTYACCDVMGNFSAAGTMTILSGILLFISVLFMPCANICLARGPTSKKSNKKEKSSFLPPKPKKTNKNAFSL